MSAVLTNGTRLCLGLIIASGVLQWTSHGSKTFGDRLQARSVPSLIVADLQHVGAPDFWPRVLLDAALAVLLLTPYVRVLTSLLYSTVVERDRRHAWYSGIVLLILTILVLTNLV